VTRSIRMLREAPDSMVARTQYSPDGREPDLLPPHSRNKALPQRLAAIPVAIPFAPDWMTPDRMTSYST
jgi:hypothetical protein